MGGRVVPLKLLCYRRLVRERILEVASRVGRGVLAAFLFLLVLVGIGVAVGAANGSGWLLPEATLPTLFGCFFLILPPWFEFLRSRLFPQSGSAVRGSRSRPPTPAELAARAEERRREEESRRDSQRRWKEAVSTGAHKWTIEVVPQGGLGEERLCGLAVVGARVRTGYDDDSRFSMYVNGVFLGLATRKECLAAIYECEDYLEKRRLFRWPPIASELALTVKTEISDTSGVRIPDPFPLPPEG